MSLLNTELAEHILPDPAPKVDELVPPQLVGGKPPPPQQLILLYSADDWEEFLKEWGHYQKKQYHLVTRLGGANDYGIDVACFCSDKGFHGEWDNYQCKHYTNPLTPKTAVSEIGKIIWHIHSGNITCPRKYYFFAPKDCGPSLIKLLLDKDKLKSELIERWEDWCSTSITSTQTIKLTNEFGKFVDNFDFSVFQYKPSLTVIEEHEKTPYHTYRFFKTLKARPAPEKPPAEIAGVETRYIAQLHEAYSDYLGISSDQLDVNSDKNISGHFLRQRENFYFAEFLRLYSRDNVPPGTFEILQDELLSAVVDVAENSHDNGLARVKAVTMHAQSLAFPSNILHQVMKIQDKQGMCHQLANDNKLTWVPNND